ncbi:hypothetical protein FAM09_09055 [Niastella caeni]|uniref:Entericidin n=1 Tax=Niastella caeni TaxID=2569763 RepID=A0A4S8I0M2_9BACT|nr:hypothetical protein [Niastella caeni]THU40024.1 hypothetical protein FAM09_09055 [Niastella caeni]
MKKLLLVLAIGSFVACNDGGSADADKTAADTAAAATVDTPAPAPTVDTTAAAADTTKKADTTIKK